MTSEKKPRESASQADINDQKLRIFPILPLEEQIQLYDSIKASGKTPERELLRVSESTLRDFSNCGGYPSCPMDQDVYKVRKGHIVMIEYVAVGYEAAKSKTQAGFMENADLSDPKKLRRARKSLLENALTAQRPFTDPERYSFLHGLDDEYSKKTSVGIVEEPPSGFNDGLLRLNESVEIGMSNIRLIHIIGIDSKTAKAQRNYAQVGDRVEVLYEGKWHPATVTGTDWAARAGLVDVFCDQKIHNEDYEGGHGLAVRYGSDYMRLLIQN